MKQICSEVLRVRPSSYSLRTTKIISLSIVGPGAELFLGKFSSFLADVTKSIGHDFEKNLAGMRPQREAPVYVTLGPILLFV